MVGVEMGLLKTRYQLKTQCTFNGMQMIKFENHLNLNLCYSYHLCLTDQQDYKEKCELG